MPAGRMEKRRKAGNFAAFIMGAELIGRGDGQNVRHEFVFSSIFSFICLMRCLMLQKLAIQMSR